MIIESSLQAADLKSRNELSVHRRQDEVRMSSLMRESIQQEINVKKEVNPPVVKASSDVSMVKAWYENIKTQQNITRQALISELKQAFPELASQKEAMWYAYNKEKSIKGTDEANSNLLDVLKQELVGDFANELRAVPPSDNDQLRQMLSEKYSLSAHKEQALWHAWEDLKAVPEMKPVVDLVRQELSLVISKNAIVKNMLTHSHKLDLS
ncbi:YopR family T3SS polymerization control protein [Vibrio europaeus]|uniref:YopR family T3SS polymerization control protein n=1 Tax=Vibrio europaeus TaxID=300876 RepID=A0AAE7ATZ6_9VIBR|nr:YopR family T3SS polymerization control protein [Vibrio europaeus]MDC5807047.1 YopR family T3SS polymerization control protein [Vibrio europaeus]MDC5809642.1 YopR family T3SS polymerization control protein [Vibrio europaeus]MDC5827572.1 YopR family T3SS polymerization control protein [Vibrio europaeus]MDC5830416.1 YopR family T3SS polymerization control protein [Vibrio europaeus]MDC5837272.1 YopR family T3SS polymerization control protein [Vibrio europaeus]